MPLEDVVLDADPDGVLAGLVVLDGAEMNEPAVHQVGESALHGSRVDVCELREVCFVDVDALWEVLGVGDVKQRVEDVATSERELSADRPLEPCVEEVDVVVTFATSRWAYR